MLQNFFKDSAAVIESLDELSPICVQVSEEIKKFMTEVIVILLSWQWWKLFR